MRYLPLPALLLLTACPSAAPSADQFAVDASAADIGSVGDSAGGSDGTSDGSSDGLAASDADLDAAEPADAAAQGDTTIPGDSVPADSSPADSTQPPDAAVKSNCATGLELFAKEWNSATVEGFEAVVADGAGGALLVGGTGSGASTSQAIAVRVSALGGVVWSKELGGNDADRLHAAAVSADGFVAVGSTRFQGTEDGWLVRFSSDGKVIGDHRFGGSSSDRFGAVAAAGDGWLAAGSNRSIGGGQEDGWLARIDAAGQLVWEQKYGGGSIDNLTALTALPGGQYAAAGDNRSDAAGGSDAWLLIVDANGKVLKSKTYHAGEYDEIKAIAALPGGGLVLTGQGSVKGNPELWVIGTDAEGNPLWQDLRGGNQDETGRAIAVLPDGGFFVVGDTSSSNDGALGGIDAWLMRYDAHGNRLWDKHIGGSGNEWFTGAAVQGDQGLWLAGRRWLGGGLDSWYLRSSPWGHTSCSSAGLCKGKFFGDCGDTLLCTADLCDSASGCSNPALPSGASCGGGKVCAAGACQ